MGWVLRSSFLMPFAVRWSISFSLRGQLLWVTAEVFAEGALPLPSQVAWQDMSIKVAVDDDDGIVTSGKLLNKIWSNIKNPSKLFSRKKHYHTLVEGLTGCIKPGEMVLVLGPPGSGNAHFVIFEWGNFQNVHIAQVKQRTYAYFFKHHLNHTEKSALFVCLLSFLDLFSSVEHSWPTRHGQLFCIVDTGCSTFMKILAGQVSSKHVQIEGTLSYNAVACKDGITPDEFKNQTGYCFQGEQRVAHVLKCTTENGAKSVARVVEHDQTCNDYTQSYGWPVFQDLSLLCQQFLFSLLLCFQCVIFDWSNPEGLVDLGEAVIHLGRRVSKSPMSLSEFFIHRRKHNDNLNFLPLYQCHLVEFVTWSSQMYFCHPNYGDRPEWIRLILGDRDAASLLITRISVDQIQGTWAGSVWALHTLAYA